jgi:enamine deaminase RidA (YjgF/YER057c/UK114 family)
MDIYERSNQLNITLPETEIPFGAFRLAKEFGDNFLCLSGAGPVESITGKLGDIGVAEGKAAARSTGISILGILHAATGNLNRITNIVKAIEFVSCTGNFTQQTAVVDGFSDLMIEVFGDKIGAPARSAISVASLPGNIPVEVELLVELMEKKA